MNLRQLSLRTKLVCALAVVMTLSSCPLVYLGYAETYRQTLESFEQKFANTARILDKDLELTYLNSQNLVVEKSGIEKEDMVEVLGAVEKALDSEALGEIGPTLQFMEQHLGLHVGVVSEWGEFLNLSPMVGRIWRENPKDYLGMPLDSYFKHSFNHDVFTVLELEEEEGGEKAGGKAPFLMGVRTVPGYTLVVMKSAAYLRDQFAQSQKDFRARLSERIESLDFDPRSNVTVFTDSGETILQRGKGAADVSLKDHPEFYERAVREGVVYEVLDTPSGRRLFAASYFKPTGWFIRETVPASVLEAPARRYAARMAAGVLGIFALLCLFGWGIVSWLIRPLRQLSESAQKLERVNFSLADVSERLREIVMGLPYSGRDEIGRVSRAFRQMVLALEKNIGELKLSVARQHNIEGELHAAREIQRGMLTDPAAGFKAEGFEASALMIAAKEVGGDFYDVLRAPDGREVLVLGDVSGKGVSAALLMCVSLTLVRNAVADGLEPAAAMKKVNDQLARNNPNCMFVTLWIGYFDPATGRLDYANGGHCPPAVVSASAETPLRWLDQVSGPLVGALEMAEFVPLETVLEPGDLCFIYSDGVSEAMNEARELFGAKRIESVLLGEAGRASQAVIEDMMRAIERHRRGALQSDDITMLVFRRGSAKEAS